MIHNFKTQRIMKKRGIKLNNVQEQKISNAMSEQNFKIYLRVKPSQVIDTNYHILKILNQNKVQITSPYYSSSDVEKTYTYQEVFGTQVNNKKVFLKTMIGPVSNVLRGYNSTIFIYGMTGSGKTYTMFGTNGSSTSTSLKSEQDGLVSMTVDYIFNQIQKQPHIKSQITVCFYQIYNQNIRDLLQEQIQIQSLTIMQDPIRGVFVNGLNEVTAQQTQQIKDIITAGIERRAMNATKSNQVSSRSHAILQFNIKRYINSNENETSVLQSKFFMIDLAGNQKTSNNQSRRFIQGVNINKSLLTLGKCLSILADGRGSYVPFRDSKLTRILKQSLGGNSKTVMIACVSSQKKFYDQTLNTLKYSSIAKKIKNKGVKNNIKIIPKQQLHQIKFVLQKKGIHQISEIESKIKQSLKEFLQETQIKLKIQYLMNNLQISRKQNEDLLLQEDADYQLCRASINKINDTLKQLMRPYQKQLQKVERLYQQLISNTLQLSKQKIQQERNLRGQQISYLRSIITSQQNKIQQFQRRFHNNSLTNHFQSGYQQFENSVDRSLGSRQEIKNVLSPNAYKQNSSPLNILLNSPLNQQSRSLTKNKKLTINCTPSQDSFRPALSSLSNYSVTNLHENTNNDKRGCTNQKQIVINLNIGKQSQKIFDKNKQQFVKKLKQTEKKAKKVQQDEIASLLQQQQTNKYELGNAEMSMIRKLKFFQRQKSLTKNNSLSTIGNRRSVGKNFW